MLCFKKKYTALKTLVFNDRSYQVILSTILDQYEVLLYMCAVFILDHFDGLELDQPHIARNMKQS